MECRIGCGACCIAPSITSPMPGMPHGKPAGTRCVNLTSGNLCSLFGKPERPDVCRAFQASPDICGETSAQALIIITRLERLTKPTSLMSSQRSMDQGDGE